MEIVSLANEVLKLMIPLGSIATNELVKQGTQDAWKMMKEKFMIHQEGKILKRLEKNPDSNDAQAAFRLVFSEIIENDEKFRSEVEKLCSTHRVANSVSTTITKGDNNKVIIVSGTENNVRM